MNSENMCMGCMTDKRTSNPVCPLCGYDESERRSPLILKHRTLLADQYVVGKVLGKPGGFGITYLGWDTRLETMVAIKEYLPRDNAGRDTDQSTVVPHSREDGEIFRYGLEAFLLEARTLAKFDHANVVRVRTFFEANGTGYLVMDYYDGMSLESYLIQKGGKIPEKLAVNIMMPILDGLREVHEKGFLHRDIKPHNIYLTKNGKPILLDFGAARSAMGDRSRSLSVLLTPGYAPYEQYQRKGKQGVWTDIYACGATLYRMVIGKTPPEAIERERDDDLIAPSKLVNVSRGFQAAVIKSLEMQPSRRQQSIKEFQDMLFSLVFEEDEIPVLKSETPSQTLTPPQVQPSATPPRQTFQPQSLPQSPQPEKKSPMLKWVVIGILLTVGLFTAYSMGRKQEIQPASTTKTEQVAEPATESKEESEPATEEASEAVAKEESKSEPAIVPETTKLQTQASKSPQENINEQIILNILGRESFYTIENKYVKPAAGNVFFALHIQLFNKTNFNISGGGSDYHSTFKLVTYDGYTIMAENTSSDAWRKNRLVWNVDLLAPNEKAKGWIVFSIPENTVPKELTFTIDKHNSSYSFTGLGTLKIPL
ncbi:MAG: protein kinase [Desulfamplus sp.]|nr:protein kinase [Desulfamplus sp.]